MKPLLLTKRTRSRMHSSSRSRQAINPRLSDISGNDTGHSAAQNSYEKYVGMAREALIGGDRVLAESFYQQAEHHLRIYKDKRERFLLVSPDSPSTQPSVSLQKNKDFEDLSDGGLNTSEITPS
jgi:hypothetical protein